MRNWSTDKIIGVGLVIALFLYIIGFFVALTTLGITAPLDVASNIVTGICGYMGRSLLENKVPTDKDDVRK